MKKILILAFLIRAIFLFGGYHPDVGNHIDWGMKFWEYGPKKFYEQSFWGVSWPNQPPGTIYLWALIAKIKDFIWSFFWWLNVNIPLFPSNLLPFFETKLHPFLVKLPSIFSELGIGWLVYLIVRKLKNEKIAILSSVIFLFNPITFYNSAIWGQTDGLINFLGVLAIYLFLEKKSIWGVFSFFASLYFKTSLIIFSPIILALFFKQKVQLIKVLISVLTIFLAFSIISLPFVVHNNAFKWLYDLYLVRVFGHQGNMLTANAFNLWALLFGIDFSRTDQGHFLLFSFRQWGQFLFLLFNFPVFLVLVLRKVRWEIVFMGLVLIAFSAFLFLTNMHERYLYPLFPFLVILLGFYPNLIWSFIVLSIIHFLNLYNLWFYPKIGFLIGVLSWQNAVLVRILSFFLLIVYAYFFFFFLKLLKSDKIKTG
jgi:Gpi18-like mannosyltransferase